MSALRQRMLKVLDRYGALTTPQQVADAPIEDLWDLKGFGAAATYECRDWLREHGLANRAIDDWIALRAETSVGDPRKTHDPVDYTYDSQTQRAMY